MLKWSRNVKDLKTNKKQRRHRRIESSNLNRVLKMLRMHKFDVKQEPVSRLQRIERIKFGRLKGKVSYAARIEMLNKRK